MIIKKIFLELSPYFLVKIWRRLKSRRIVKLRQTKIDSIINSREKIFLEFGSGTSKDNSEWITADIAPGCDLQFDLLKPFPFPDNSVDKIYSSHVLEHFLDFQISWILKESLRILKPNGEFSVCVPNARRYIDAYLEKPFLDETICRYKPTFSYYSPIDYVNYTAYMGGCHLHMFDEDNLIQMLVRNGFKDVQLREFEHEVDKVSRKYESIYARAFKAL